MKNIQPRISVASQIWSGPLLSDLIQSTGHAAKVKAHKNENLLNKCSQGTAAKAPALNQTWHDGTEVSIQNSKGIQVIGFLHMGERRLRPLIPLLDKRRVTVAVVWLPRRDMAANGIEHSGGDQQPGADVHAQSAHMDWGCRSIIGGLLVSLIPSQLLMMI